MSTINPDITRLNYTVVVTAGKGSQAFPRGMANKVIQIIVIPPSGTPKYDIFIIDGLDTIEVFRREDEVEGVYNEILSPALPLFGNNTFYIRQATVNGNYKVRLVYE